MPRLVCWSCGRELYTVSPLEALFKEERRCPRCGAFLREDRRMAERRVANRRRSPASEPAAPDAATSPEDPPDQRRVPDRRSGRRRGAGKRPPPANPRGEGGWVD